MKARCPGTTHPNCANCTRRQDGHVSYAIHGPPPWFTFPPIDVITGKRDERETLREFMSAHTEAQP